MPRPENPRLSISISYNHQIQGINPKSPIVLVSSKTSHISFSLNQTIVSRLQLYMNESRFSNFFEAVK